MSSSNFTLCESALAIVADLPRKKTLQRFCESIHSKVKVSYSILVGGFDTTIFKKL